MNEFEEWATATFHQSKIEVNPSDLGLIELIYTAAIRQLEVLDGINLEEFPAVALDLRHAPRSS